MIYLTPRQALNKAFLKVKPTRHEINLFKNNLTILLNQIKINESEEFHKNNLSEFLKNTYYRDNHYINTKNKNDLVIHLAKNLDSKVGVILETKSPTNQAEMPKIDDINTKACQQLLLYYLQERIIEKNIELKYLIITNIYQWFIFDASLFDQFFAQNQALVKQFTDFTEKRLTIKTTDLFYKNIAQPALDLVKNQINFTYFNLKDYQEIISNNLENPNQENEQDKALISLYKILSPQHLLKLSFLNDSNILDQGFYNELLHIIGLKEVKIGVKKLIQRPEISQRNSASLLENTITQLDTLSKVNRLENVTQFGANYQEQLFNIALELVITWINRILFLKLLESQLINYHKSPQNFSFLNLTKIPNFDDLNSLFFQVLARQINERSADIQEKFSHIPYLNSSLFELSEIEDKTIVISNLKNEQNLPIINSTILKDNNGKKCTGKLNTLEYLLKFLDAYDFSSEGSEDIQEDNKTLINASVLGLIFEKINGYQDGSFFTPGFITMYMCKETIYRAVLQKFNEVKGWHCENMAQLHDKIEDNQEANTIINSIKICDPAVGSGHFLVSALNEIIALKSELKILLDRTGKRLKYCQITVENDELIVTDEDGIFFEYNFNNQESQRIQETLFYEKQTIIENCLFGVDINPNSVNICRLRLWIELLKNAYYRDTGILPVKTLETLPNLDINIKCGNSLISRYELNTDLRAALKKNKLTINDYKKAIKTYLYAESKEQKWEIEKLIKGIKSNFSNTINSVDCRLNKLRQLEGELNNLLNQTCLFEETKAEKKVRLNKQKKLEKEINLLNLKIDDMKNNCLYQNALEWRFEFPEVLNEDGNFIGFDVVIGNPPYIRQEEFSSLKPLLKQNYKIYNSLADLLTYFVELGFNLLKNQGTFQFIISNKFTRANYGQPMRNFLLTNTSLTHFIDFSGVPVFDEATVDVAVVGFTKNTPPDPNHNLIYASVKKDDFNMKYFTEYISEIKQGFSQGNLTENSWTFEDNQVLKIKQKIEAQGIPLKQWNIEIVRGIITGYNEAFIISGEKRQELIAKDAKSADIIKPILRGRDLHKYYADFQDLWLINLHNGYQKDNQKIPALKVENYPAIKEHLDQYFHQLEKRTDKGKTPYNLRNCAYIQEFEKPKIIYPNMTKFLPFMLDLDKFYTNQKCYILTGKSLEYLTAFFNSQLFKYCFQDNFPKLGVDGRELSKVFFEQISVKQITEEEEKTFQKLVTQIIDLKKANSQANITQLEREIDNLIYQLYELTEEEINLIEMIK